MNQVENNREIYLDYNATTPCDPGVVEKMLPFFGEIYGNPSNGLHRQGRLAAKAVDTAREQVAALIGAKPYEIFFTAGATESNNLAILGLTQNNYQPRKHILTSQIEHKAVINPCQIIADEGYEVNFLPVDSQGTIKLEELTNKINESTLLVSIHYANNEIGTIQPIKEISEIAHEFGAIVHTDAAQAVGKILVNVDNLGVDLLSISAHKLYGPKGVGALYIRGGKKTIPLSPLMYGGGQEQGIRPGTTNVPAIVGFGEACKIAGDLLFGEEKRIASLRDRLETVLQSLIPEIRINAKVLIVCPIHQA